MDIRRGVKAPLEGISKAGKDGLAINLQVAVVILSDHVLVTSLVRRELHMGLEDIGIVDAHADLSVGDRVLHKLGRRQGLNLVMMSTKSANRHLG